MGFRVSDRNLHRHKVWVKITMIVNDMWHRKNRGKLPSSLGNQRQLPDGRVMPDSVRQRKHVTAVHFTVTLVAGCEVQQGEGIPCPLRLRRQGRGTDYRHNAVMENNPVGFLTEESSVGFDGFIIEQRIVATLCERSSYRQCSDHKSDGVHPSCDVLAGN